MTMTERAVKASRETVVLVDTYGFTMPPLKDGESVSLTILSKEKSANFCVRRVSFKMWKNGVLTGSVNCAIGQESTARLVEQLLGVKLDCARSRVEMIPGGIVYIIQLSFQPEDKGYTLDELERLIAEDKITFYQVHYDSPIIC